MTDAPTLSPAEEALRDALRAVIDPDLHRDLVTLNMVRNLRVEGERADFDLVLTTGACPVKQQLEDQCRAAALGVAGVRQVEVRVSAEVPKGPRGEDILPGVGHVIGVGSGKGGVGKSTVTVNLACALAASGASVGLLDADIYGPSVPTMMGINRQPLVQDKKLVPLERHGVKMISMGFLLEERQAVVWRGPMLVGALKQFLTDVAWGSLDYLLVDLPPGTGDIQLTLSQQTRMTGAVIISTPQAVALADVRRSVSMFQKVNVPILGIVENMGEFICPACGHAEPIFGHGGAEDEATHLHVPFLGRIPLEPSIRRAGDDGTPVVTADPGSPSARAFRQLAGAVAQQASIRASGAAQRP
jgi:ATP-binding protein involved in chromosome partitioning